MRKIAVTIPDEQRRTLEQLRRRQRLPRSRGVQHALRFYFEHAGLAEDARAYEEAYRRKPERAADAGAYLRVAAKILESEDWT